MATPTPIPALGEGDRLETIEIRRVLVWSMQGVTYLGRDPTLGPVIVKEFRGGSGLGSSLPRPAPEPVESGEHDAPTGTDERDEDASDRDHAAVVEAEGSLFLRAGRALVAVRHPNVARVHRCFEARGTAYMVMEYVAGPSLAQVLASGSEELSAERSLRDFLVAMLGALGALHGAGVVHRDLKPGNILFRREGTPVLLDFSAALPLDRTAAPPYRSMVTPGYAAPEQYVRDGREGPWTDLYGLACVGYRLISGEAAPDALDRLRRDRMTPAAEVGRGRFSPSFLAGVDAALRLDPGQRPQTAEAWLRTLEQAPGERMPTGEDAAEDHGGEGRAATAASAPGAVAAPPRAVPFEPSLLADPPAVPGDAEDDEGPPTVAIGRVVASRLPAGDDETVGAGDEQAAGAGPAAAATGAGRRRRIAMWAAALLALALLPLAAMEGWSYYLTHIKSEWIVDASGAGDVETIGEALRTAKAGAVIKVRPGEYRESLVMERPVSLHGEGDIGDIRIIGSGAAPCLAVRAETGSVKGLRFIGPPSESATSVPCLYVTQASTVVVAESIVSNEAGPALRVQGSADPVVRENRFGETAGVAVVIEDGARGTYAANVIADSTGAGVLVRGNAQPIIRENRIQSPGQAGILVEGNGGGRLADNKIVASTLAGIEVRGRADPAVVGNRIESSGQAGVYVHQAGRGLLEGNEIAASTFSGVVVGAGASPVVARNTIRDGKEHGILVLADGRGRYTDNTISGNAGHGIALDVDAAAERGDNTLTANREPQIIVGEAPDPRRAGAAAGEGAEADAGGGSATPTGAAAGTAADAAGAAGEKEAAP